MSAVTATINFKCQSVVYYFSYFNPHDQLTVAFLYWISHSPTWIIRKDLNTVPKQLCRPWIIQVGKPSHYIGLKQKILAVYKAPSYIYV